MACEYGWEAILQNLEIYALRAHLLGRVSSELVDVLERALANMSSRGALRAASNLAALLRNATLCATYNHKQYSSLRAQLSTYVEYFAGNYGGQYESAPDSFQRVREFVDCLQRLLQRFPKVPSN